MNCVSMIRIYGSCFMPIQDSFFIILFFPPIYSRAVVNVSGKSNELVTQPIRPFFQHFPSEIVSITVCGGFLLPGTFEKLVLRENIASSIAQMVCDLMSKIFHDQQS